MVSFRKRAREAVPKVFQTFNSLLGGIVRKKNATIVGPSKQLVGEFPTVDFERLYQYYHHWDQIKTAVDVMHQKFRGSGIEIKTNNEYFNTLVEKWWDITNSEKKWSQFIYSLLITGSAIMELQFTPDGRLGNEEQIPMQTIYRLFRDQFGNELKIVQIVDGVFKELDPEFFIHHTINNPDRQAFGKSMFNTLASPRPIVGKQDPITGEAINAEKNLMPLLDMQAILQNDEMEIKHKMAKPRLIVGANGMPRDQMEEIQAEMADPDTDQYIWIFDKPVQSAELQVQQQGKFDTYGENVDAHIDVGTVFASNVIKNPQGFSYSGAQTPFDVLDQRMGDLQGDLAETIKDRLLKPLAETWGFEEFDAMEVEVTFTPTMKRLTMEDIRGLDPETVSPEEKREMYKKLNIPLDDQLWEDYQSEMKEDKQDEKNIQMQGAITGAMQDPNQSAGDPASGDNPFKKPPAGGDDKDGDSKGGVQGPKVTPPKTPFETDRPKPTPTQTPQPDQKKPRGENLHTRLIKEIANEGMTPDETIQAIKAVERIHLPPKAGDNANSSSDLYVTQGIDDEGTPEITDPSVRDEFGLDKDESELPPSAPSKMAHVDQRPNLQPADNTNGRFTNIDNVKNELEYHDDDNEMDGDEIQGGLGNDGINPDSDGSFKDPQDRENDMERLPETGNTDNPMPHAGPNQEPLIEDKKIGDTGPDAMTFNTSGGSDALPDNTNKQILGGNDDDEQPIVPSEGDPRDDDEEEIEKKINRQNLEGDNDDDIFDGESVFDAKPEHTNKDWFKDTQVPKRDAKHGEEPFTSGTDEDRYNVDKNLEQPRKPQAKLDDSPLFEEPNADSAGTIDPNKMASRDYEKTYEEEPTDMLNDNRPDESVKYEDPVNPEETDVFGDSGQVRLHREEETGEPQDQMLPNDSTSIMDNTGLNVKPEIQEEDEFNVVSQDDYLKKTQSGENPLEQAGDPLEDGLLMKPEDVQQYDDKGKLNNDINDPSISDTDEDEVDPNILHTDPETGINYTDLTDEQGNEVPDLRFDQTPESDEDQPDVELEWEVVTREEYDQHMDASKGDLIDPNQPVEGEMPMEGETPIEGEVPMEGETPMEGEMPMEDNPLDPTELDEDGNPVELDEDADKGIIGQSEDDEKNKPPESKGGDSPKEGGSDSSESPKEGGSGDSKSPKEIGDSADGGGDEPDQIEADVKEDDEEEKPKKSPKKSKKDSDKPKKKDKDNGDKESDGQDFLGDTKEDEDSEDDDNTPKRKGTVKDIIEREHELLDKGEMSDDEIHQLLEDEFGEDRIEKAEETKTWINRR